MCSPSEMDPTTPEPTNTELITPFSTERYVYTYTYKKCAEQASNSI